MAAQEARLMSSDRLRQITTVVVYVLTVAVNAAANALPINGQQTREISDRFEVFVVPAGYVFAIWGVIYLLLLAFTVYQAMPSRGEDPVLRSLGWLPALTGVLNTAWLLLFHYEVFVLTVPVMVALLVTLIVIHGRIWERRAVLEPLARWVVAIPFSIYLGWITVATIANVAQTLSALGFDGFGIQPEIIASVVLLLGLAIALTFVWRFRDAAYGLVIVWAYAGIVVKEADAALVPIVAGVGAIAVLALVLMSLAGRLPPAAAPVAAR
jgi:hypothetical protein